MTSQTSQHPEQNQQPNQATQSPQQPPTGARRKWIGSVEQQIAEARERGDFDNLPGQGQPLRIEPENPHAGAKSLAYSLLKNNGMAPAEIERGKEIRDELQQVEALLRRLRHQRDTLQSHVTIFASDRRAYNVLRASTERRYAEQLRALNSKILSHNITTPSVFHQRLLDVEAKLRAFDEEFPPLPE